MQRFRVDLKTFLVCLTNTTMLSESKYLADFLVGFLGKKSQILLIPIYSTTVLYDMAILRAIKQQLLFIHSSFATGSSSIMEEIVF